MPTLLKADLKRYLLKLEKQLQILPSAERQDILKELESQFYESTQQGEDPASLLARLGKPQDYARPFLNVYLDELQEHGKLHSYLQLMWKKALLPGLVLMLAWVALMLTNSSYIYSELLLKSQASPGQVLQLMLSSIPAILVISLPFVALLGTPLFLFALRGQRPQQVLRQPRAYLLTLLMGLSFTLFGFGLQELLVPASNRYAVSVLKQMMEQDQQLNCSPDCKPIVWSSENKDVRSLSALEARKILPAYNQYVPETVSMWRDFYSKFSLPLANLACALFGLMTASLMLSGMFHPYYTLLMIGTVLPLGLWYWLYSALATDHYPALFSAFAPNLALAAVALLFLIGLLLPGPHQRSQLTS